MPNLVCVLAIAEPSTLPAELLIPVTNVVGIVSEEIRSRFQLCEGILEGLHGNWRSKRKKGVCESEWTATPHTTLAARGSILHNRARPPIRRCKYAHP